jgi:hypothetical protein
MTVSDCCVWAQFPFLRCIELVTARRCASELARCAPGDVVRNRYAHLGLHFAPRRWLLLEPQESLVADLVSRGAHCSEASGKWKLFIAVNSDARATLAAAVDLEELLGNRKCARAHLFDCPVVLARLDDARTCAYLACVEASYEASWTAAVQIANSAGTMRAEGL